MGNDSTVGIFLTNAEAIFVALVALAGIIERAIAAWRNVKLKSEKLDAEKAFDYGDVALKAVIAGIEQAEKLAKEGLISNEQAIASVKAEINKLSNYLGVERNTLAPAVQEISEAIDDLWNRRIDSTAPAAPGDVAIEIRELRREPAEALPHWEVRSKDARKRLMLPVLLLVAILPLSGCALFGPTVRQGSGFLSRESNQKLTPELVERTPLLSEEQVVRVFDDGGNLREERQLVKTYGMPTIPLSTKLDASESFADSDTGFTSKRDSVGSSLEVNRTTVGNADTLGISAEAQVARTIEARQALNDGINALTAGIVQINSANRQAEVENARIAATRDVELAKLIPDEEVGGEEGEPTEAPSEAPVAPTPADAPAN